MAQVWPPHRATLLTLSPVSPEGRGKQTHRQDTVLRTSALYWFRYKAARKASRWAYGIWSCPRGVPSPQCCTVMWILPSCMWGCRLAGRPAFAVLWLARPAVDVWALRQPVVLHGQGFPPSLCCSHMAWPTQTPQAMRSQPRLLLTKSHSFLLMQAPGPFASQACLG